MVCPVCSVPISLNNDQLYPHGFCCVPRELFRSTTDDTLREAFSGYGNVLDVSSAIVDLFIGRSTSGRLLCISVDRNA